MTHENDEATVIHNVIKPTYDLFEENSEEDNRPIKTKKAVLIESDDDNYDAIRTIRKSGESDKHKYMETNGNDSDSEMHLMLDSSDKEDTNKENLIKKSQSKRIKVIESDEEDQILSTLNI